MSLNVVLYEPEIPWNTGNIGRTCVGVGAALHLVGKLGFSLSQRQIRRSGLDYWPKLKLFQYKDLAAFEASLTTGAGVLAFSAQAEKVFWDAPYMKDSYLLFGSESRGLPESALKKYGDRLYRIPISEEVRSLNLSTAAAIALYEGVRQTSSP